MARRINIGRKCINELNVFLEYYGLSLADDPLTPVFVDCPTCKGKGKVIRKPTS